MISPVIYICAYSPSSLHDRGPGQAGNKLVCPDNDHGAAFSEKVPTVRVVRSNRAFICLLVNKWPDRNKKHTSIQTDNVLKINKPWKYPESYLNVFLPICTCMDRENAMGRTWPWSLFMHDFIDQTSQG